MELTRAKNPLPLDPSDPVFYTVPPSVLPPRETYYYLNPDRNLTRVSSNKKAGERKVFYGWNNLTDFEITNIIELKEYMAKNHMAEIPNDFDDRDVLKFL